MIILDIKSEIIKEDNFEENLKAFKKKVESCLPGKTIMVTDLGKQSIWSRKIHYKIIDKVDDPIFEIKEIANLLEVDKPEIAKRLKLIAEQIGK